MDKMKVMYQTGLGELKMGEAQVPAPAKGQLLIKVAHTGICGSDLHYYEHGRVGDYVVEYPFILGHESGGYVAAIGAGGTGVKVPLLQDRQI